MKFLALALALSLIPALAPCERCGAVEADNMICEYHECATGEHFGSLCQSCREDVWTLPDLVSFCHEC